MGNSISIKGTREGLTVTLGDGDLAALLRDLQRQLQGQGAFFRGGRVALNVGDRPIGEEELSGINNLLAEHQMILRTVVTTSAITEKACSALGLRLVTDALPKARDTRGTSPGRPDVAPAPRPFDGSKGVLIRHVVRSGQVVRHTGHVVIIGDVNPGGEVIAGGDIVIWGRLYGTAHAGAMGGESSVICALELTPVQLRIADHTARPQENDRGENPYPEIAYVRDNVIVVEPWDSGPPGA